VSTVGDVQQVSQVEGQSPTEPRNFSLGGFHLATNDWWTPKYLNVSLDDWDGDGVSNSQELHPLDPGIALHSEYSKSPCIERKVCNQMLSHLSAAPTDSLELYHEDYSVGDVNNDGWADIVAVSRISISIFYNNQGEFSNVADWQRGYSAGDHPRLALGDINSDGKLDLVISNSMKNNDIFLNQNGTFLGAPYWSAAGSYGTTSSVDIGDIDSDGDLDLVFGTRNAHPDIYLNHGNGLPTSPSIVVMPLSNNTSVDVYAVKLADLDADGDLDLIVGQNGKNQIWEFTGTDYQKSWESSTTELTKSIAVGDIDLDGDLDIAFGNDGYTGEVLGKQNYIFLNMDGDFENVPDWSSMDFARTKSIQFLDVNKDGWLDLVAANGVGPEQIHLNLNGDFSTESDISIIDPLGSVGTDNGALDAADMDGDGDIDLLIGYTHTINLYKNSGSYIGNSSSVINDLTNALSSNQKLMDFDGDGNFDIMMGGTWGALPTSSGCGDCGVVINLVLNVGPSQLTSEVLNFTTNSTVLGYELGDIDNDGDEDLIVKSGKLRVFLNQNGSFNPIPYWTSSADFGYYDKALLVDVNLDGFMDVAALSAALSGPSVGIYLNSGGNYSSTPSASLVISSTCGGVRTFEASDFNNNGYPDFFFGCDSEDQVFFNSHGTFSTIPDWKSNASSKTHNSVVGDLDRDGDLDIVIVQDATSNNYVCKIIENLGGTFSDQSDYELLIAGTSLNWGQIRLGDINSDGKLDLYCSEGVYLGNESGFASEPAWRPDISLYGSPYFRDLNNDGYLDIRISSYPAQIFYSSQDLDSDWHADSYDDMSNNPTQFDDPDQDGFGSNLNGILGDSCSGIWGDSWRDRWGCGDEDSDGQSNLNDDFWTKPTQWIDSDKDGFGDNWADPTLNNTRLATWPGIWIEDAYRSDSSPLDFDNDGYEDEALSNSLGPYDACPLMFGTSSTDRGGCQDSDGDGRSDRDSDWGAANGADIFHTDVTQWIDSDEDGFGDNPYPANNPDQCPEEFGTSFKDGLGCRDSDGDGWGISDDCPQQAGNSTVDRIGCPDEDEDGYSDQSDSKPNDPGIWSNIDGDEFFDQGNSSTLDACPNEAGTSTLDRYGCIDLDGDGWSFASGSMFAHPLGNADSHPDDFTQWRDRDGDRYGDNLSGNTPDSCPDLNGGSKWLVLDGVKIPSFGCLDSDFDGFTDESDDCPNVAGTSEGAIWGCADSDNDGTQDVEDSCPSLSGTSTANLQGCPDSDGDGLADLEDPQPLTPLRGLSTPEDWDGDGVNNLVDLFPFEETQWQDLDNDGYGDNSSGVTGDPSLDDFDNDFWLDPSDLEIDALGCLKNPEIGRDFFPENLREWMDSDGDCIGDNSDPDDDNDGYSDVEELQQGTDPLSSQSKPIEGFEIIVPGTEISLGAWDLIGILGGVPVFIWIAVGFVTRNGRTARYEEMLHAAESIEELEQISGMWEYSLMMRMLGPHQGIRLERLRGDLEYEFPVHRRSSMLVDEYDQTEHAEKSLPGLEQTVAKKPMQTKQLAQQDSSDVPVAETFAQSSDENGYEWYTLENGTNFYRTIGSGAKWVKFEK